MEQSAYLNPGYIEVLPSSEMSLETGEHKSQRNSVIIETQRNLQDLSTAEKGDKVLAGESNRDKWGNDIEFLLSCISLSVGLGNVWRFPFTALENGGGAFVIPYLVVLFLVGKPVYYMEMLLGQFSSRGSVKVFDFSPITRGIGYGQVLGNAIVMTYYATLLALTIRYFSDSFQSTLPWSYCREDWPSNCVDSTLRGNISNLTAGIQTFTSAEYYFENVVLQEKDSIDDGIGYPNWKLALCLAISWIIVALIMIKGVRSSGKASYFLALFPYVVMLILLIRALSLPGSLNGVIFFIKPQWDKLLTPQVWYAAVTQVFFSLSICFGNIVMLASYNRFGNNIQRDVTVVTTLDTFTSLLSGVIIFGILGNLAYEKGTTDIQSVVKGGPGLAFISYPDAIAKFSFMPQIFSVLFFLMLFVLGIGSNVGQASCIMTVIKDRFINAKQWMMVLVITITGFLVGLIYLTPGGQFILTLIDFHGASFVALVLAVFELIAVSWIYGVKQLCKDAEFMLGVRTSLYYRLCWSIITPITMAAILFYTLASYQPVQYKGYTYSSGLYAFGWCLSAFGILQLVIWGIRAVYKQPGRSISQKIVQSFKPLDDWGPLDTKLLTGYKDFNSNINEESVGFFKKIYNNIFG